MEPTKYILGNPFESTLGPQNPSRTAKPPIPPHKASILTDIKNLSTVGRIVCTVTFLTGSLLLFQNTIKITRIPAMMRVIQEERNGDSVFRSSPEELFLILPKYPADKAARKKILAGKLNEIALVVPIKHRKGEASTPSDLILTAAQRGFIHPLEGQRLLKELDFFQTKENIDNSWTVSDPAPIHKTPVTPQESTKETPKPQ